MVGIRFSDLVRTPGRRIRAGGRGVVLFITLAMLPNCRPEEPAPVRTARAFVAALQSRDSDEVLPFLTTRLRTMLEADAEKASDQVGGRDSYEPAQMLELVGVELLLSVRSVELVEQGETTARVQIRGDGDVVHLLDMVLEDGSWRVVVPSPS